VFGGGASLCQVLSVAANDPASPSPPTSERSRKGGCDEKMKSCNFLFEKLPFKALFRIHNRGVMIPVVIMTHRVERKTECVRRLEKQGLILR
jgi:hypothetical protein